VTQVTLYAATGLLLFCTGLYGLLAREHLLRKILALNVMGTGIFLFLVAVARREPELPPDPVPHAMVLTGIVVTVSATAFVLALARRYYAETGRTRLPEGPPAPEPEGADASG
jgi:multicomponent Na+:H+ antiporter subunit C